MQTLDRIFSANQWSAAVLSRSGFIMFNALRLRTAALRSASVFTIILTLLALCGCGKNTANDAIKSDANGYLCLHCNAKLFTPRTVFIEPKCPVCGEDKLRSVVGYFCEKDQHLTIRPMRDDPQGAPVCEVCKAPLSNAMRMPQQKDLEAWGAKKAP